MRTMMVVVLVVVVDVCLPDCGQYNSKQTGAAGANIHNFRLILLHIAILRNTFICKNMISPKYFLCSNTNKFWDSY